MNMQFELQMLGVVGLAIHYLSMWVKANNDNKEFSLKKAIPNALLSAICTGVLIYLRKDIENIYVVTPMSAIILGYFGNSVFFSIVNSRKPKIGSETSITETETADRITTEISSVETKPKP